jgi:multidrug resistance efflux pump
MTANRWARLAILALGLGTLTAVGIYWLACSVPASEPSRLAVRMDRAGVVCIGFVDLEHGTTPLHPLTPGRVACVPAHDNNVVSAGTVLVALDDTLARLRVQEAQAALEAAQTQLDKARKLPAQQRLKLAQQDLTLEAMRYRLSAAKHLLAVKQKLLKDNFISAAEVSAVEDQIKELAAMRTGEEKKLAELQLVDPRLDVRAAEAEVKRLRVLLREAEQGLAECAVTAPQAGTVMRVLVRPGAVLDGLQRQPAVLFAPDEPRIVRAEVDQEFAARVTVGKSVRILDDSNVQDLGRGRVTQLSDWFLRRRMILLEPTRFNDARTLECLVTLDAGHAPLRLGQRVQVRIEE